MRQGAIDYNNATCAKGNEITAESFIVYHFGNLVANQKIAKEAARGEMLNALDDADKVKIVADYDATITAAYEKKQAKDGAAVDDVAPADNGTVARFMSSRPVRAVIDFFKGE